MFRKITLHAVLSAAIAVPALLGGQVTPASAFGWHHFAACDSPSVFRTISHRFRIADRNVIQRDLAIVDYLDVYERNYEPATEMHRIARRYCQGKVAMSDGHTRSIWYLIEKGQGFAGVGDNVEFCIDGLDPWHVYGAYCRSVR
ncbi:hypothetical protein [Hoeflea prorocentri]|uniref:Cytoplasmic protein n=1 Tax=Hoeflea prorocentri TaxID=1922333 RepID=A0A9X3UF17_9HYPH|nr:hypothetical protein [Hoeflea prorocentri]MCY6380102.1 hypothetical protein [Hoeflea prorocentri]MDA5397902.1 hypothetical protein [Hoeflea prorocentri]